MSSPSLSRARSSSRSMPVGQEKRCDCGRHDGLFACTDDRLLLVIDEAMRKIEPRTFWRQHHATYVADAVWMWLSEGDLPGNEES